MVTTRSAARGKADADVTHASRSELIAKPTIKHKRSNKVLNSGNGGQTAIGPAPIVPTRINHLRPSIIPQPAGITFQLEPAVFGLIQERIQNSLYALVVQAILWNQTRGLQARPVLFSLLEQYPTPEDLACAKQEELSQMLQPIGLHNTRAMRLIALGKVWIAAPPCKEQRYRKLHYPVRGAGSDVKPGEILDEEDQRVGWEIAHLPGMGPYALDSYRIFHRDRLRGVEGTTAEPEWMRVVPDDKDLKAYMQWRWSVEDAKATL